MMPKKMKHIAGPSAIKPAIAQTSVINLSRITGQYLSCNRNYAPHQQVFNSNLLKSKAIALMENFRPRADGGRATRSQLLFDLHQFVHGGRFGRRRGGMLRGAPAIKD